MTEDFESPLDKIIREARERGEFDNLPGSGRPLAWEDESHVPEEERMARRLLKHNDFTLDWIEMGRELDEHYNRLRAALEQARREKDAGTRSAADWFSALDAYRDAVRALNRRVTGYNMAAPSELVYKKPYPLE